MDTSEAYIKMCDCEEVQKNHGDLWLGDLIGDYYENTGYQFKGMLIFEHDGTVHAKWYSKHPMFPDVIPGIGLLSAYLGKAADFYDERERYIWLPRQDQIQAIVNPEAEETASLTVGLFEYMHKQTPPGFRITSKSMEQLWLMFYMSEKHNKKWNGEKWEDIK